MEKDESQIAPAEASMSAVQSAVKKLSRVLWLVSMFVMIYLDHHHGPSPLAYNIYMWCVAALLMVGMYGSVRYPITTTRLSMVRFIGMLIIVGIVGFLRLALSGPDVGTGPWIGCLVFLIIWLLMQL